MVYWHGRSLKRFIFQSAINLSPRISGLSPLHPPRRYPFEGLPENHVKADEIQLLSTQQDVQQTETFLLNNTL